jgi:hypothetical protein
MPRLTLIRNFLLFQTGWFACVLGGAYQLPLLGSSIAVFIIALHLWLASDAMAELKLLLISLTIGLVFESLMVTLKLAHYDSGILLTGMAPHWMILMWPLFATTLNVSMSWMKRLDLLLVSLLGAVLAPFAYFAGAGMQAVVFDDKLLSLFMIALGWALLLPVLVTSANRFNGYAIATQSIATQRNQINV